MLNDGVGVVLDGASEVVFVADLDGFVDRRSQPRRHACSLLPLRVGVRRLGMEDRGNKFRVWNVGNDNEAKKKKKKKVKENRNEHRRASISLSLSLCDFVGCFVSDFQMKKMCSKISRLERSEGCRRFFLSFSIKKIIYFTIKQI